MTSFNTKAIILFSLSLFLIILPPVLSDVPCAPVEVRSCPGVEPSSKATLAAVYIQDCFDEPCFFRRGQTVSIEMDIDFHAEVKELKAEIRAMAIGGPDGVPWPGFNPVGCNDLLSQHDCPLKDGDYVTYGINVLIQSVFPPIRTDVKYFLKDENDEILVCWLARVELK